MHARFWSLLVLGWLAGRLGAQESVRDLSGPGQYSKFLTHNQLDRWLFQGDKGETILAHVVSKEFDPILELTAGGAKEDKVLLAVDDPGSESRFAIRLPDTGKYEIRVHAFKYQGGGNYTLRVQRFRAAPLAVGKASVGTFDREGKSYHFFPGTSDQILVPEVKGATAETWQVLDAQGRPLPNWAGAVHLKEDGECYLVASGPPEYRFDLLVREARRQALAEGKAVAGNLQQGELDVAAFQGKPGDFRFLEVEKKGEMLSRLVFAPVDKKSEQRLPRPGDPPPLTLLPVASRGGRLRFAAILGREGRYQLQLRSQSPASYTLSMSDPSVPIAWGAEIKGALPVGGAAFYSFKAAPGQLVQASLSSKQFVPALRLYDSRGDLVGASSDDADGLEGRITHMVVNEGLYRLHVASLGDGGGGDFALALRETKLKELQIGDRGKGTIEPGATEFWSFAGKQGQTVFLSVRSATFEPAVSLRSPDGVLLAADNKGGATGSLLALKLPRSGRYTVWISPRRGAGEYTVRLIDGE